MGLSQLLESAVVDHPGLDETVELSVNGATVQANLSGVGQHQTDENFHQRGLTGAVLAENAVDLPTVQCQIHAVARDDLTEALGDVDQFHSGRGAELPTRHAVNKPAFHKLLVIN